MHIFKHEAHCPTKHNVTMFWSAVCVCVCVCAEIPFTCMHHCRLHVLIITLPVPLLLLLCSRNNTVNNTNIDFDEHIFRTILALHKMRFVFCMALTWTRIHMCCTPVLNMPCIFHHLFPSRSVSVYCVSYKCTKLIAYKALSPAMHKNNNFLFNVSHLLMHTVLLYNIHCFE